ncbi:MAG: hypothetical protein HOV79_03750 [Hamadaea sp.]|nr:hypothetical protein [Hamadaea sp.]
MPPNASHGDPLPGLEDLLDEVYVADERVAREEIVRRATAADLPALTLTHLDALPEGEYARDEVVESVRQLTADRE